MAGSKVMSYSLATTLANHQAGKQKLSVEDTEKKREIDTYLYFDFIVDVVRHVDRNRCGKVAPARCLVLQEKKMESCDL